MLTYSWRKAGSSAALALSAVVGLPALAQAQLFPNLWIQRQREACANEPPFYAHVRQNFYGYYPTCWRRFPDGWTCPCPNPELPNASAAFAAQPRDEKPKFSPDDDYDQTRPLDGAGGMQGDPGASGAGAGRGAAPARGGASGTDLPPLPDSSGSAFDSPDRARPNATTPPAGGPPPAQGTRPAAPARPATTPPSGDPFDPIAPNLPRSSGSTSSSPKLPAPNPDGPPIDLPAGISRGADQLGPVETTAGNEAPVLALPEMTGPSASPAATTPVASATMPPTLPTTGSYLDPTTPPAEQPQPAPAQAPKRSRLIGGLMNLGNKLRR